LNHQFARSRKNQFDGEGTTLTRPEVGLRRQVVKVLRQKGGLLAGGGALLKFRKEEKREKPSLLPFKE